MKLRLLIVFIICTCLPAAALASKLFIPMDAKGQSNHLKAYGIAFAAINDSIKVEWLLNYKGGSFAMEYSEKMAVLCRQRGVRYTKMSVNEYNTIVKKIAAPGFNGDVIRLAQVPKIAVYTPSNKKPWDDAVTLALTYAEIPFDKLYAEEVLAGDLGRYDWLHLHHEDFTGQYGKFWGLYQNAAWYKNDRREMESMAGKHGFKKVSQMQLAVVKKIRDFVAAGGNLFAMCSATDTYDIALAAEGTDICDTPFDGDKIDPQAQTRLDYTQCFAFKGFTISTNLYEYEYSTIDNTNFRFIPEPMDSFALLSFPAKFDPVPAMLCQNHTSAIKGFMGQTTAFRKETLKPGVLVMADKKEVNEARYIHGQYKKGTWTFYGGHDPEDYQHMVGEPPTDLAQHTSSPGYRLILNNVLFPATQKKDVSAVVCCQSVTAVPQKEETVPVDNARTLADRVKIYPNPANNELIIALMPGRDNSGGKIERIAFINADGKEVFSRICNTDKVSIDMESLPAGMYLVKVNGAYAGKVVKN